jgi:hypothetical protein
MRELPEAEAGAEAEGGTAGWYMVNNTGEDSPEELDS